MPLLLLAACQADATPTSPVTTPVRATAPPNITGRDTVTPDSARAATPVPPPLAAPTQAGPRGSLVVVGAGAASKEITALPEFISNALFDSLLTVNATDGALKPGLAERWLVSDDAKTIIFILRQGVKWHDGQPLTADDVVFTLKTLSNPDVRLKPAADFGPIANITAMDARTISVTLSQAYCAALTYIGTVKILPKHRLENQDLANVSPQDLIGTGPLALQKWGASEITFTANRDYWNGAPQIVNWTYKIVPDAKAAQAAVQAGAADVWVGETGVDAAQNAAYKANEFFALAMNTTRPPFDDVRVRQAIASAVNPADWVQQFGAQMLETSTLPTYWAFPAGLAQPAFDAARAKQQLADAGWRDSNGDGIVDKDGKPLQVALWAQEDDARSETAAQLVRMQLEKVGVRAILKLNERTLFLTRLFLQEYDLAIAHFNIPLDPDQRYFWSSGETQPGYGLNVTGYSSTQIDQILEAGNRVARCDPGARKTVYASLYTQLASDVPMVFLFAPLRVMNASNKLSGIAPSSFAGAYWNLNAWEVAP